MTPYSLEKNFFKAIDQTFNLIEPRDWVFILDGDTLFLRSDFGHRINEYTCNYPETGLFTSYASRCHYKMQVPPGVDMANDSIVYHKNIADQLDKSYRGKQETIHHRIAGHLMGIKRTTWTLIRDQVKAQTQQKAILGVDTKISNAILDHGLEIRLMKGIYLLHYLRLKEGFSNSKHLLK